MSGLKGFYCHSPDIHLPRRKTFNFQLELSLKLFHVILTIVLSWRFITINFRLSCCCIASLFFTCYQCFEARTRTPLSLEKKRLDVNPLKSRKWVAMSMILAYVLFA